jgi:exopolysaccharide biosynthesis polyprenyl glycosylphosphotransferase
MSARYSRYLPAFVFIADLLLLNFSIYTVHLLINSHYRQPDTTLLFVLIVNACWCCISGLTKSYNVPRPLILNQNVNKFIVTLIYHLVIVLAIIYFFQFYSIPRLEFLISHSLFFVLAIFERSILYFVLDYIRKKGYNHRQIIIIGDEQISKRLSGSFAGHPEYGYDLVRFIPDDELSKMPVTALFDLLHEKKPDELFICYKQMDKALLKQLLDFGKSQPVNVKVVTDLELNDDYAATLVNYHNIPVMQILAHPQIALKIRIMKRSFDIIFSLSVLTFGLPLFIILYIITRLTSKGPAFYVQERVGKNEKPFYIYKFRSMFVDAEKLGPQLSSSDDPRITKWGRLIRSTRLDEIPQFWNVLIGEMSVVGPRPERQHFIEQIIKKSPDYKKLFSVKPGLTSIGQVHYGYAENVEQMRQRLRYDLLYLDNVNFNHELDIIAKTVRVMVQRKGK